MVWLHSQLDVAFPVFTAAMRRQLRMFVAAKRGGGASLASAGAGAGAGAEVDGVAVGDDSTCGRHDGSSNGMQAKVLTEAEETHLEEFGLQVIADMHAFVKVCAASAETRSP